MSERLVALICLGSIAFWAGCLFFLIRALLR